MPSTIGPARQALFALLELATFDADSGLAGTQLTFGVPDAVEEQRVVCMLGLSDPAAEDAVLLGPLAQREERFHVEVAVKVYDPAGDPATVDADGFTLADAVRDVVRANVTLTGTVRTAFVVSSRSAGVQKPVNAEGKPLPGWVIQVDMSVGCSARA